MKVRDNFGPPDETYKYPEAANYAQMHHNIQNTLHYKGIKWILRGKATLRRSIANINPAGNTFHGVRLARGLCRILRWMKYAFVAK